MAEITSRADYADLIDDLTAEEARALHQTVGNSMLEGIAVDRAEITRLIERITSHRTTGPS